MKIFFSVFIFIGFAGMHAYGQATEKAIKQLYDKHSNLFIGNRYISDSMKNRKLTFEEIRPFMDREITKSARLILDSGHRVSISPRDIAKKLPVQIKIVSNHYFENLKEKVPKPTTNEQHVLLRIIELQKKLSTIQSNDTLLINELMKEQNALLGSKYFSSFSAKKEQIGKRIFIFYPVYIFKGRFLFCFSYFKSATDDTLFVDVF